MIEQLRTKTYLFDYAPHQFAGEELQVKFSGGFLYVIE